jgi:N-acetylneuraminic acid mutarotase
MPQFMKKNDTHAIFYGGYRERVAWSLGPNVFYNDMYFLDVSNPDLVKWSQVNYDPNSLVPRARSYECAVYSEKEDAVFMFGGLNYTSNRSLTIIFSDSWVYRFSSNSWTQLDVVAPPGTRAGHGCALDESGENLIVTQGIPDNRNAGQDFIRDVWSWNLATNTWTNLTVSDPLPIGRWLFGFSRIPGTNNFIFLNGRRLPAITMTDVWEFNGDTKQWRQFEVSNIPNPPNEVFAYALTSSKYLLLAGGDADGNKTVAETCLPPLICRTVVTPQDTNFFLRLRIDQGSADWEDEAEFDHTVTRHRHATIVIMEPYLYLYGGHDWDGTHGIGEIYNTHTWGLKLPNKYWN